MHEYPLRISEVLWKRIEIEAEARGLLISDMLREIIEKTKSHFSYDFNLSV